MSIFINMVINHKQMFFFNFDINKYKHIYSIGNELGINIRKGIYTWTLGPTYETPAEVQDIVSLGGDAVGMSTVPEIMKALDFGMNITGISCLTNFGAGLEDKKLLHSDVLNVSREKNKIFIL